MASNHDHMDDSFLRVREYTLSAVKNAVAAELVREITLAALRAEH